MKTTTIAQLAKAAGVGVETVRYYQRRGLMPVPRAGEGAFRHYDEDAVKRLRFIRHAQTAGFTLEEIGELLALDRGCDRARVQEMAHGRLDALAKKLAELHAAQDALQRLLHSCEASEPGPCPIIEAFDRE
jgi:MerR family mercuric resistance operon transcriptional regulator